MILFLDASSLLKLYLQESGSETMRELFEQDRLRGRFYISDHVGLEVFVRLNKFSRSASRRERRVLKSGFEKFATHRANSLNILTIDQRLIAHAEELATRYADSGAGTLDLIHLASVLQVKHDLPGDALVFIASDRKLKHVAARAKLRTFDPEKQQPQELVE